MLPETDQVAIRRVAQRAREAVGRRLDAVAWHGQRVAPRKGLKGGEENRRRRRRAVPRLHFDPLQWRRWRRRIEVNVVRRVPAGAADDTLDLERRHRRLQSMSRRHFESTVSGRRGLGILWHGQINLEAAEELRRHRDEDAQVPGQEDDSAQLLERGLDAAVVDDGQQHADVGDWDVGEAQTDVVVVVVKLKELKERRRETWNVQ